METQNSHELTVQQKAFVREIVGDPVLFAEHMLGSTCGISKPTYCGP
jgi:hypothetical protein